MSDAAGKKSIAPFIIVAGLAVGTVATVGTLFATGHLSMPQHLTQPSSVASSFRGNSALTSLLSANPTEANFDALDENASGTFASLGEGPSIAREKPPHVPLVSIPDSIPKGLGLSGGQIVKFQRAYRQAHRDIQSDATYAEIWEARAPLSEEEFAPVNLARLIAAYINPYMSDEDIYEFVGPDGVLFLKDKGLSTDNPTVQELRQLHGGQRFHSGRDRTVVAAKTVRVEAADD